MKQSNSYTIVNSMMKITGFCISASNLKEAVEKAKQVIKENKMNGHFGVSRDWCGGAMGSTTTARWI